MASALPPHVPLADGELDLDHRVVRRTGRIAHLTEQETDLLRYLAVRLGQDIPREELMTEVLGYAVTARSRAVDLSIRRLRTKLEINPSEPRHLLTVYGVGYRLEPAREGERAVRTNLPPPRTSMVGRSEALAEALEALRDHPLQPITFVGPPGVGKTRLAREVAREAAASVCPAGAFWVDLSGATDVLAALAHATGLSQGQDASTMARALASRGPTLVLLDDAESNLNAARDLTRELCDAGVSVLVTSRVPLHVSDGRDLPLDPLTAEAAARLFEQRASEAQVGWQASSADREGIGRIVEGTDALPLALELAATRIRSMSVPTIAAALDRSMRLLRAKGPGRHASVEAAMDWSWEDLGDEACSAICQLSVFRDGAPLEAIPAVVQVDDPMRALDRLVTRSLVRREGDRVVPFHIVRQYAASRAAPELLEAARERHRAWYAAWARDQASLLRGPETRTVMEHARREQANLEHALQASLPHAGEDAGWLVHLLSSMTTATSGGEIAPMFGEVLAAIPEPSIVRGRVLHHELWHQFVLGRLEACIDLARQLRDEADQVGDLQNQVDARRASAAFLATVGRGKDALDMAMEAATVSGDDPMNRVRAIQSIATVLMSLGRTRDARQRFEESMQLADAAGDVVIGTLARTNLGTAWAIDGNEARARAVWDEVLPRLQRPGDRESLSNMLYNRGCLALYGGRPGDAIVDLERAVDLDRDTGRLDRAGWNAVVAAVCAACLGLPADAVDLARYGIEVLEGLGLEARAEVARSLYGAMAALHGDAERARTELQGSADALAAALGDGALAAAIVSAWTAGAEVAGVLRSLEARDPARDEVAVLHRLLLRGSLTAHAESGDAEP